QRSTLPTIAVAIVIAIVIAIAVMIVIVIVFVVAIAVCRCGLRGLAEHAAASWAQAGPLPFHAGDNSLAAGNFRGAEPKDVRCAKPSLIFLGKGLADGRPQREAHHDTGGNLH